MTFSLLCGSPCSEPKIYRAGATAYLDSLRGLVPCRVIDVINPGNGWEIGSGMVRVRVTRTTGAWPKGHVAKWSCSHVVPTKHVVKRGPYLRITTNYRWE